MKTTSTVLAGVLLITVALANAPAAHAGKGWLNVRNCSDIELKFSVYDWKDAAQQLPANSMILDPGEIDRETCRKSWGTKDSPGCKGLVELTSDTPYHNFGRLYSGDYTVWAVSGAGYSYDFYIRSGIAEDCNSNDPKRFTLTGDEVSGCTPELVIYGTTDKSGDSYVLKDAEISHMTNLRGDGSLNDWVRALEVHAGRWQICEHVDHRGACLQFWGAWDVRLDIDWNGDWDRRISSIRPIGCN